MMYDQHRYTDHPQWTSITIPAESSQGMIFLLSDTNTFMYSPTVTADQSEADNSMQISVSDCKQTDSHETEEAGPQQGALNTPGLERPRLADEGQGGLPATQQRDDIVLKEPVSLKNSTSDTVPGHSPASPEPEKVFESYMTLAMLVTFCCNCPLGFCAVLCAWRALQAHRQQDHVRAAVCARAACLVSVCGVVLTAVLALYLVYTAAHAYGMADRTADHQQQP